MAEALSCDRVRAVGSRRNGQGAVQEAVSGTRQEEGISLDFTNAAVSELQSIRNYTLERRGSEQEDFYLDARWAKFEAILSDPQRWRHRDDLFPGGQIAAQGRHVILFRILSRTLEIVRMLHGAIGFFFPGK